MNRLFFGLSFIYLSFNSLAQGTVTVSSSNGYQVEITLGALSVIAPNTCPNGYVYQLSIPYSVSFTGTNIPGGGLNTLQGTVTCNAGNIFFDLPNIAGTGTSISANAFTNLTNCQTATLTSLGCNTVTIEIQGTGIGRQFIPVTVRFLPITLHHFSVDPFDNGAIIKWSTLGNQSFSRFEVERSKDLFQWQKISSTGYKSDQLGYEFKDLVPGRQITYYRLKLINSDESYFYSDIESFNVPSKILLAYPNPFRQSFQLDPTVRGSMIHVLDLIGRSMLQVASSDGVSNINSSNLPNGLYLVSYQGTYTKMMKSGQ